MRLTASLQSVQDNSKKNVIKHVFKISNRWLRVIDIYSFIIRPFMAWVCVFFSHFFSKLIPFHSLTFYKSRFAYFMYILLFHTIHFYESVKFISNSYSLLSHFWIRLIYISEMWQSCKRITLIKSYHVVKIVVNAIF